MPLIQTQFLCISISTMQISNTKKILFFIFFTLQISLVSIGQSIKVSGKVINTKNEPVSGASIIIEELKRTVVANLDGQFNINIEAGKKYTLSV